MMKKRILLFLIFTIFNFNMFGAGKMFQENELHVLIAKKEIDKKIKQLAGELNRSYKEEPLLLIMILKGSIFFAADLMRELKMPTQLETVRCSSYSKGTQREKLKISGLDKIDAQDKNVLIVDDIFDSGTTIGKVAKAINKKRPKSLKTATLLVKNTKARSQSVKLPDYYLFEVEDKFVIGYGLDYKENYRGLKNICYVDKLD